MKIVYRNQIETLRRLIMKAKALQLDNDDVEVAFTRVEVQIRMLNQATYIWF